MAPFFQHGPHLFDGFRQDALYTGDEPWAALSQTASDTNERIARLYRSKHKPTSGMGKGAQKRRPVCRDASPERLREAFRSPTLVPYAEHQADEAMLRAEYTLLAGRDVLDVHRLVRVWDLPENMRKAQEDAIEAVRARCTHRAAMRRVRHICLRCEFKGRRANLRLCTRTRRVSLPPLCGCGVDLCDRAQVGAHGGLLHVGERGA